MFRPPSLSPVATCCKMFGNFLLISLTSHHVSQITFCSCPLQLLFPPYFLPLPTPPLCPILLEAMEEQQWQKSPSLRLALTQDSFFESVPRLDELLPLLFFHPMGRYQKTRNLPHLPVWAQQCPHGHQGK